ncbi:hypothetical protein DEO72_LG5g2269 [Vigna unguiculata]|uniref:Uncharacterized protein n=1 Tax=Vigna unguiculata TaxID=3917 RepID=A0A4D6LZ04_VIGUN|nr:hypothetical protein DEO72_LG5g2269 [Vigna unguiculata]
MSNVKNTKKIYFSFGSFFPLIFLSTFTRLKKRSTFLLLFFWLMFCSESLEQLDEDKKDFLFFVDKCVGSRTFTVLKIRTFTVLKTRFTLLFVFSFFYTVKVESFNLSLFDDDNKDYLLSLKIYQWTLTTPSLLAAKFKDGFITVHLQENVT